MKSKNIKSWISRISMILAISVLCGVVGGVSGYIALSYAAEINLGGVEDYYIPYQGRLELGGDPVNGPTEFKFALYKNQTGTAASDKLWTSAPRTLQVSSGYFATVLGDDNDQQNGPNGRLKRAIMEAPALYIAMTVDGVELSGRQRILAVPYAQAPAADKAGFGVPIGGIVHWYPPTANSAIPAGYAVCNGQNGTPNLIDRFVRGTSNLSTARSATANGSDTHTHGIAASGTLTTNYTGSHSHSQVGGDVSSTTTNTKWKVAQTDRDTGYAGAHSHSVASHDHNGNTGAQSNLPTHLSLIPLIRVY